MIKVTYKGNSYLVPVDKIKRSNLYDSLLSSYSSIDTLSLVSPSETTDGDTSEGTDCTNGITGRAVHDYIILHFYNIHMTQKQS